MGNIGRLEGNILVELIWTSYSCDRKLTVEINEDRFEHIAVKLVLIESCQSQLYVTCSRMFDESLLLIIQL